MVGLDQPERGGVRAHAFEQGYRIVRPRVMNAPPQQGARRVVFSDHLAPSPASAGGYSRRHRGASCSRHLVQPLRRFIAQPRERRPADRVQAVQREIFRMLKSQSEPASKPDRQVHSQYIECLCIYCAYIDANQEQYPLVTGSVATHHLYPIVLPIKYNPSFHHQT
jgi:hypothetical protein